MKTNKLFTKLIFAALFFAGLQITTNTYAQTELWGMTHNGGDYGTGTIFKTDGDGNNHSVVYSPFEFEGKRPEYTQLCEATNGLFYGMTSEGGLYDYGVLFEFNPANGSYTKKIDFDGANKGIHPSGSLVLASNGKLYGLTRNGGTNSQGVLFEYNPANGSFTKKIDFDGTAKGRFPQGSLMQATNGKLYGLTWQGGYGLGVLFEYNPTDDIFIKKIDFDGTAKGSFPYGSLMQATNGKLYGLTQNGGSNGDGVLFEFNPADDSYTKKIDFDGTNKGSSPYGSLIQATNGKLYGLTKSGGASNYGVLFEYNPTSGSYLKKIDFDGLYGTNKGHSPYGSLMQAANGLLYGMTYYGGQYNYGMLFEYNTTDATIERMIDFDGTYGTNKGRYPYGSLIQTSNGKIYGMTSEGGANGYGVIFEYNPSAGTYALKHEFLNASMGESTKGSLVQASSGKLYGMTASGGANGYGVIFEYAPSAGTYTLKHEFDNTNGANPNGSLMEAGNGNLYGMTAEGGANNRGVIFEYDPSSVTYTNKLDFNGTNGSTPIGSLMQASNGKLYGMTYLGGAFSYGVIFEYDLSIGTYTNKHDFDETNGSYPFGRLVEASNGKLYGLTWQGGANGGGVIFEYDPFSSIFTKKYDFDGTNGSDPFGSLMEASNGNLYGMTSYGGVNYDGVIFEYDPFSSIFTKKYDFDYSNGGEPYGSLMQAANGKLYGMTGLGGVHDNGVIFEYDLSTGIYTKKLDFDGTNGSYPAYTQLIEVVSGSEWTGTNSSDWDDQGNWEFNEVPNPVMDVTIPPTYLNPPIIDQEAVAHDLTIDGGNLEITENGNLTLSGELINNGIFNIQSNILGTGSFIDNGTMTGGGSYGVERFMDFNGWHLIGSPISNGTANMFLDMYLQRYNESGVNWIDITDENTPLIPGTGYALWHNAGVFGDTYYFYGNPNTGSVSMPVTADNTNGWNLLSNPYPSAIDWDLVDKSDINGAIYYYDADAEDYVSYNGGMGGGTQYIPPAQGFFVSAPAAGILSFDNSVRSHAAGVTYYKSSNNFSNYLELKATGNNLEDKAYMRFTGEASASFDGDYDAYKLFAFNETTPQVFFIAGDDHLSINCLPETASVEVGFSAGVPGEYTISLDELIDIPNAILEDKLNGEKTDLQQSGYTFQYSPIDMVDRFILHFTPLAVEETVQSNMQVYTSGNTLYINSPDVIGQAHVKVLDVTGRTMEEFELGSITSFNKTLSLPTGYYLVSIQTGTEIITKKVFIK